MAPAKEQSSCSDWTGIALQTEHCCGNWEALRRLWAEPRRIVCPGGAEVVRRIASRKPQERLPYDRDKIQTQDSPFADGEGCKAQIIKATDAWWRFECRRQNAS
jgi:hypothetical protein